MISVARIHRLMRTLPLGNLPDQTGNAPILILAPHPDDETLGCGGLIAQACAARQPVHVLVLTDGSRSHPNSAAYPAASLRRLREAESRAAARALGLAEENVAFLGLPDTSAPHRGEAADRAASLIVAHARDRGATCLFTSWRHDPHCDHLAASELGRRAAAQLGARLWEYPVWGWTLPPRRLLPAEEIAGFRLDISGQLAAKRRAIACHRSQLGQVITDDPTGFTLPDRFLARFTLGTETYLRTST